MADPTSKDSKGVPQWVKISGIVALIVVVVVIAMLVVGGGNHGPGRHSKAAPVLPSSMSTAGLLQGRFIA